MPSPARPIVEQLSKLWARVSEAPVVRWATVTQASPLRVRMDGDTAAMPITPQTAVTGLTSGQRVLCVEQHRRVIVVAGADQGWTNITSLVTLASGLSWSDGGSLRVAVSGGVVSLHMNSASTNQSGFMTVGPSGNVENTVIISGLPAQFRPPVTMPLAAGTNGRLMSYVAHPDGTIQVAAVTPNTTWTSATPFPAGEFFSFGGSYIR